MLENQVGEVNFEELEDVIYVLDEKKNVVKVEVTDDAEND